MRLSLIASMAALALLLAAPAVAQGPDLIKNPVWVEKPNGDDMAVAYPDAALRQGLGGKSVLLCDVTAEGRLTGCAVVEETPKGMGFAEGMLSLTSKFRMRLTAEDGQPVAGRKVKLPMVFRVPEGSVTRGSPWTQYPTDAQMKAAYPKASRQGGTVEMRCVLQADGSPTDCRVVSETPAGAGFGAATLEVSRYFKARPPAKPGEEVDLNIVWPALPVSDI